MQLGLGDGGLLCEGEGLTEISRNLLIYIVSDCLKNTLVLSSSSSSASPNCASRISVSKTSCSSCSPCASTCTPRMVSFGGRSVTDLLRVRYGPRERTIAPTWETTFIKKEAEYYVLECGDDTYLLPHHADFPHKRWSGLVWTRWGFLKNILVSGWEIAVSFWHTENIILVW